MQIENRKVVTIDYVLTDASGAVVDKSEDGNFAYLHGAGNIVPGLENALASKTAGDALQVSVVPEDGYGQRDESMVQVVPRTMFEPDQPIDVGMQFHAQTPEGGVVTVTIATVSDDEITIDGNHPLAGVQLNFEVKVVDVRDATDEEAEHGHVHGPGDHHHD